MTHTEEAMGPVSYLIIEFPGTEPTGEGLVALMDTVDRGLIRILDLVFVARSTDGHLSVVELRDMDGDGQLDLAVFDGVSSGLLDDSDLADASAVIAKGSSAAILVFENHWATAFVQAVRHEGAELVAAGYIPATDIAHSLDATEPARR